MSTMPSLNIIIKFLLKHVSFVCFCRTANKGPKHKSVLQFRQLLVMSLKSLKIST